MSVTYCLALRSSCTDGKLSFIALARLKLVLVVACGQRTRSPFLGRWEHFNVMPVTHPSEKVLQEAVVNSEKERKMNPEVIIFLWCRTEDRF